MSVVDADSAILPPEPAALIRTLDVAALVKCVDEGKLSLPTTADGKGRVLVDGTDVTQAIHYALARWPQLLRYCGDGRVEIDNNGKIIIVPAGAKDAVNGEKPEKNEWDKVLR